ncbi:dystrophin, isoforms A/C/F/G/H-like isoform X2 [Armigeres subalbatus]|uniref:dystrophin, isoforms A/C/F/G/H-like isoform X2 n=1 Tax=Armigeres subalbatus TaxID=124917 RepID=UPI002ED3A975
MEPVFIDERQDIQKKTFTKWINGYLAKSNAAPINDLFEDLRDGHKLLSLLEVLTNRTYKREKGCMRVHQINNLNKALTVLQECGVKLVNISSDDINSGNAKLTLGLIWLIALSFDGQKLVNSQAVSGIEKSLLNWVRQFVEKHGIKVTDFSSSWSDGTAFLAILAEAIASFDLQAALKKHPIARLRMAFDLAYRYLGIEQLLDPEDVNTNKPDKKSILMYVMCLYNAIDSKKLELQGSVQHLAQHVESMEEIQLLCEKEIEDDDTDEDSKNNNGLARSEETITENDEEMSLPHAGNLAHLEEISLAQSIDDLRNFNRENKIKMLSQTKPIVQRLEHAEAIGSNLKTGDLVPIPDKTDSFYWEPKSSRPVSTATNFSVEFSGYQTAVEEVLTMLLEAEELFSKEMDEAQSLAETKKQFHDHEQFMEKLSEYQTFVCGALDEGSRLISESQANPGSHGLDLEGQNEIKQQLFLLNERWEMLRVNALERQSKIQKKLAFLQMEKIDKLKNFLTMIEDRISHMSDVGPTPVQLKAQLEQHKVLKNDMEAQENLVDSLSNLVIIIDSDCFSDLEDKLSALEERWLHLIKWISNRWEKLQSLSLRWTKLSEQYRIIRRWIESREYNLKKMEMDETVEMGAMMDRIKCLQYCKQDVQALGVCLQELEASAQSLNDEGYSTLNILPEVEHLNDMCDALNQILEAQEARVENMGFQVPKVTSSNEHSNSLIKPSSWEDFQMKMCEETLPAVDIMVDNLDSSDYLPQSEKKRKIEQPEAVVQLNELMYDIKSSLDECFDHLLEFEKTDLKKRLSLLEQVEALLEKRKEDHCNAKKILQKCQNLSNVDLTIETNQLTEMGDTIDSLKTKLDELSVELQRLVVKDKFSRSLTGFKLVLADTRDWYQQNSAIVKTEDLEKRLSDMDSFTDEIEENRQITYTYVGEDWDAWKQDMELFVESWNDMKNSIKRIIIDKGGFHGFSDQIQSMQQLVDQIQQLPIVYYNLDDMHQNLDNMHSIKTVYNHQVDDGYGEVNAKLMTDSKYSQLAASWSNVPQSLNDCIIKQNIAIENLNHFNSEYADVVNTLDKIEQSLKNEMFILGEIKSLEIKIKEYDQYATDLKKADIDIISIKNFAEIIVKNCKDQSKNALAALIDVVCGRHVAISKQYRENLTKLNQVKSTTENILSKVHETELWLNDLELNTPKSLNSDIKSLNELYQIKSKFHILKETCEQQTLKFRELNESGNEVLLQIDELILNKTDNKVSYLAKKFTKLNARWSEVTSLVYTRTALLEHISSQMGEFKTLIVAETGYLDKLDKLLRKSPENAADAEEISEELDDIENYIRNHPQARYDKIISIGKELCNLEFMVTSIEEDLRSVSDRWESLKVQAHQQTVKLEQAVKEAQSSESQVSCLQQWIFRVDGILNDFIENDTTIEDVPHDFQKLQEEFNHHEKVLVEMTKKVDHYKKEGKLEAANRYQDQVKLLQEQFKACLQKLNRLTSPQAMFETKLSHALAELRSVEKSAVILDTSSAGPAHLQDQFQHCLKMYRVLSEVKGEIEQVIRTGRKVCDDKTTKNPTKLSQRIDTLKHLYNSLGETVTQSKIVLENLLKIMRNVEENLSHVENWINANSAVKQSSEDEEQAMQEKLNVCNDLYDEYKKVCDPLYLEDLRAQITDAEKRFREIRNSDVKKKLTHMKNTLQNVDSVGIDVLRSMEQDLKTVETHSDAEVEVLLEKVSQILQSRIETPNASKLGEKSFKVVSPGDQSPLSPIGTYRYDSYKKLTSLEQRVNEFDKTAKYMIKKLEQTREKIDNCEDGPSVVENLKLTIAPDAATLISQGDTLILETHGKSNVLTQRLMDTQAQLRDKFKEVQNSRNYSNKTIQHPVNLNESDCSNHEYSHPKDIDLEEISSKVLKRIGDLLAKPLSKDNEIELTKRILDIKERQEEVKLAIGVASQTTPSEKVSNTMTNLEKGMRDLSVHFDETIAALVCLNKSGSREAANMLSEHESLKILAMLNESSPYKGISDQSETVQNDTVHDISSSSISNVIRSAQVLLTTPMDDSSKDNLNRRLVIVQKKQEELGLIAESQSNLQNIENMDVLEKVTKELSMHCDEVVNALAALNRSRIDECGESYSHSFESPANTSDNQEMKGYVPGSFAAKSRAKVVATALTNNFDRSVAQITDWLEMERDAQEALHCSW